MFATSDKQGNVVIGYTNNCFLMLDCDNVREEEIIPLVERYAKFHNLGSVLVMLSSDKGQLDLDLKHVKNFSIIFGKLMSWEEIMWHIKETLRLGLIEDSFAKLRDFGFTTIRVNAKNEEIPAPKTFHYFSNGDDEGVFAFFDYWKMCKNMGRLEHVQDKA